MSKVAYRLSLLLIVVATGTIIDLPGPLGSIIRVVAVPCFLVTVLLIVFRGGFRRFNTYYWVFVLFFVWRAASYFWSISPSDTATGFSRIPPLLIISLVIWENCRTREQADGALQAFVVGGFVLIFSLIYGFAAGTQGPDYDRIAAGGFNPDDFLYLLPVPVAWYLANRPNCRNKFWMWLNIGYVILAPMGIILTAGRAAFIAALPIYSYIFWSGRKVKTTTKIGLALSLTALVALLLHAGVESKIERIASTITNPVAGSSWGGALGGRDLLWAIAIKEFGQHPVLGIGATTFSSVSANTESVGTVRNAADNTGLPAHSTYLSILSETGAIGFLLFLLLFALTVRAAWYQRDRERRNAFVVAIIALAIGISSLTYEDHVGIWLLFTLIIDSQAAVAPVDVESPEPFRKLSGLQKTRI